MSFATRHEDMIQNLRNNIAIVQAFKDGVVIEGRPITTGKNNAWKEIPKEHFINFERFEYRLKPVANVVYVILQGDGLDPLAFCTYDDALQAAEEIAGEGADTAGLIRRFIEALEST